MHIKILGSGQEVGRSAILLSDKKESIVMDYGVKINPEPPSYPQKEKAGAMIISHAHLDHCGAAPIMMSKKIPVFMNDVTLELSMLLIKDSVKVAMKNGYGVPFSKNDEKRLVRQTKIVSYNQKFRAAHFDCFLYDSGHIPGSSSIFVNGKKKVFYTADIQTKNSNLLKKCLLPQKTDVLITESTYSYKNQPERIKEEQRFIQAVEESLAKNEPVLIPVFAIGRAQEILLILEKYSKKIAIDGMAKTASEIIEDYGAYLNDAKKLRNILSHAHFIKSREEREKALKNHSIIISSAGMLGGGPAVHYLRELSKSRESKVLFTGFLVEDSPGRNLIETKIFQNAEEKFKVHCDLQQFELSAHADHKGLLSIIEKTKPETVICVHGDRTDEFAKEIEEKYNIQAFGPKNGEDIKV